ncbi:MAG: hypothetical protein IK051_05930 [Rhodocyclaceae bacterium]|nr:hypothetical protein [Rhodocyclaceae bacterium]
MEAKQTDKLTVIFWTALSVVIIELFLLGLYKATERHPSYIHPIDTSGEHLVAVPTAEPPPSVLQGLSYPEPPSKSALSDEEKDLEGGLVLKEQQPATPLPMLPSPPPPPPQEKTFAPQFITKALIASCGGRLCVRVDTSVPPQGEKQDFYVIQEP